MAVGVTIKTRRGTAAEWAAANPVLAAGEQGFETDSRLLKVGDGTTAYNSLRYSSGSRSATFVIAASDSSTKSKAQADYICDGTADNVEIQAALDALPSMGGKIQFMEGTYTLAATVLRDLDNVTFSGMGKNTYLTYDETNYVIDAGSNLYWVFENLHIDYGGINLINARKWKYSNVWRTLYNNYIQHIDSWGDECIAPASSGTLRNYIENHKLITVIDDFETDGVWTPGTHGTVTYDTDIKFTGTRSAKIVTDTSGIQSTLKKVYETPIDLTNNAIALHAYLPDHTLITQIQVMLVTTDHTATNYKNCFIKTMQTIDNMWHVLVFPFFDKQALPYYNNVNVLDSTTWMSAGTPDLSQVTEIQIKIYSAVDVSGTMYIDKLVTWKNTLNSGGLVTFSYDDGLDSVSALAKPLLDVYNYKGVQSYIIRNMTDERIEKARLLQNSGWDIVSHSYNHDVRTRNSEPIAEYSLAQKWLAENNFKNGSRFALLFGGGYDEVLYPFLAENMQLTRSSLTGFNCIPYLGTLLFSLAVTQTTTADTVKSWIDIAKATGTWLILMFHDIKADTKTSEYDFLASDLETVIAYCNSQDVEVLTFSQIVDRIKDTSISNSGTGTITNGTTSVNVRHGFSETPTSIQITPTSSLGSAASIWISSKDVGGTGNLFTVSVNADPGADVTFEWKAYL